MFGINASMPLTVRLNENENYYELGYDDNGEFVIIATFRLKDGVPVFL